MYDKSPRSALAGPSSRELSLINVSGARNHGRNCGSVEKRGASARSMSHGANFVLNVALASGLHGRWGSVLDLVFLSTITNIDVCSMAVSATIIVNP